jgi:asparagine synthase (glutamine-hydrolysing)
LGPEAFCERLAAAYRESGPGVLDRLTGDFALALVNEDQGETLLAIDRVGIRGLLYCASNEVLVFGPGSDVLKVHPAVSADVDPQALYDYVHFHMVPGPETAFKGHSRLLPGCYLLARGGELTIRPYWAPAYSEHGADTVRELTPEFGRVLRQGVRAFADDASGAFLSGGTDSSTVAGVLTEISGAPARTYSIGFDAPGYDEMTYARIAARHFRTEHHEYYVTPADVVAAIPTVAAAYDQPFGNASAVPTYFCARIAQADGIARMLGGDGGDELFGGNDRYAKQFQFSLYDRVPVPVRSLAIEPLLLGLPGLHHLPLFRKARSYVEQAKLPMPRRYESYNLLERLGAGNVFNGDFLASVDRNRPRAMLQAAYDAARAESLINRMLALDMKFTLADNDLPKVTRMCDVAGIDVAFPLLHESVVEFAAALPPSLKLRGTRLRYFFKEALRDFLPDAIIRKKKHGFGLPIGVWLQTYPPLRALAGDSLGALKKRGIVRADLIDGLLTTQLAAHASYYGTLVWILMMLELWFQSHVDRP